MTSTNKNWMPLVLVLVGVAFALLAVFAKTLWIVALFGVIAVVVIVVSKIEVGIGILCFSAVIDGLLRSQGAIGSLWDDALYALIVFALIWKLSKENNDKFKTTLVWWAGIAFFVVACISGLLGGLPYGHIVTAIRSILQGSIIFFVIVNSGFDRKKLTHLAALLVICATVVAGYAVIQRSAGVFTPRGWLDAASEINYTRSTSFLGSPNATAGLLALLLPASIGMTVKVKDFWKKVFWGFCFVIIAYGLYATLNRAAWVGLSVGLVVFAVSCGKRWWVMLLIGAVAAAILILPDLRMRFESIFSEDYAWRDSIYGRSFRWGTAISIFERYPIFGIGAGGFGGAVAYGIQAFGGLYVDNNYLLILSNYGFVGIISFAFILLSSIRESFKGLRAAMEKDRYLIAGLIGGMVAFIIHLCFENLWDITPLNITFWISCGICAGFAGAERKQRENQRSDER